MARKSSEDRFLDRVAMVYGKDCKIFYGDWSRADQMAGCIPSPTVGLRKSIHKRFNVTYVDKYRTSKTCNSCMGDLSSYITRGMKRSYSRLCCMSCGRSQNRSKRFINRDLNAAANILLIGVSPSRPEALRREMRRRKRPREEEEDPTVVAAGTSSDPVSIQRARLDLSDGYIRR